MRTRNMRWLVAVTLVAALLVVSQTAQAHPSKCGNCHVPHKAAMDGDASGASYGVPLWNPTWGARSGGVMLPLPTFTLYSTPAFDALATGITQPDGPSKLCLGCHDGSYTSPTGSHTFGDTKAMTLTESHPISFKYDTALTSSPKLKVPGSLKDPSSTPSGVTPAGTIATDLLDKNGKLQCTSCHDVHQYPGPADATYMLRIAYFADNGKAMCRTCHNK